MFTVAVLGTVRKQLQTHAQPDLLLRVAFADVGDEVGEALEVVVRHGEAP